MPSEYAKALGARLRAIRTSRAVPARCGGEIPSRWKAVVVGSYERGDRAVTVQKLAELAEFYGVPVSELLPAEPRRAHSVRHPKLVIDLERLQQLPKDKAGPLRPLRRDDPKPAWRLQRKVCPSPGRPPVSGGHL